MKDRIVIVTGATNGIGLVAARELARQSATVVMVSRSADKLARAAEQIQRETGNGSVETIAADLSLMSQVNAAADAFLARHQRLDVLLNNAGAYYDKRQLTAEGLEMTFALNHLSYFLLTQRLLETLKTTAAAHGEARIINVSSDAHRVGQVNFDDIQRQKGYNGFRVYGESKLMNVLFTYKLASVLEGTRVTANALHPGFVRTGFGQGSSGGLAGKFIGLLQTFALTPEQGAETSIYLASSPKVKGVTGQYWVKKNAVRSSAASYDRAAQERLWTLSEQLVGLRTI
ncbi:MAG: SDR family oxidoreductase [Anaerolineae bacterium]|nr:SDR family oxidoreductase [Anaerolineae bacterium]MDW8172900.1 SDR family oxidoreductase [Anaerolineae bacterium]